MEKALRHLPLDYLEEFAVPLGDEEESRRMSEESTGLVQGHWSC
jgi:hypothetical protein